MRKLLIKIIKKTSLYSRLRIITLKRRQKKELLEWEQEGRPVPVPHIVKQRTLQEYSKKFGLKSLVETGTYRGDMLDAMKDSFDNLYSIELSKELYNLAKSRFKDAKHIQLIHGDSGTEIGNVIAKLEEPALFWLDGHYSGGVTARGRKETPILEEIDKILSAKESRHVLIVDDARCFGSDPAYPSIKELTDFIISKRPNVDILIEGDSIRVTPN